MKNCQKILSCTFQYVTRPSENTAISFSSLFAKEDKKVLIFNTEYEGLQRKEQQKYFQDLLRTCGYNFCDSRTTQLNFGLYIGVCATASISLWWWKSRSMLHFKGDMIVSWRMFVQMKHKEICGRARAHGWKSLHSHPMQSTPFACDSAVLHKYAGCIFT